MPEDAPKNFGLSQAERAYAVAKAYVNANIETRCKLMLAPGALRDILHEADDGTLDVIERELFDTLLHMDSALRSTINALRLIDQGKEKG